MAGPSVAIRILGDLTGWAKSVEGAGTTAQTGSSRIKGAFSSVLGVLNQSGVLGPFQSSIDAVGESLKSLSEKGATVGEKFLGAGGAVVGLGVGLQELGSGQQAAQQQLSAAITATGGSYATYAQQISDTIAEEEHHGESATETMTALQKLTQIMHSPTEALKEMGLAADVAAAKHESLTTASGQVGKAFEGSAKILKDFGITTKVSGTDALQQLADVTKGQASAASDTFAGKVDYLKTHVEDMVTTFAAHYGPAITAVGAAMTGLGATMEVVKGVQDVLKDSTLIATAAQKAATVATDLQTAATWLWNAAMDANPVMIVVLAIAALVAAFVLAYQHITVFRQGVSDLWTIAKDVFAALETAAKTVFDWLKTNWPLILGILAGPFGLIAAEIAIHWKEVKDGITAVITWIGDNWSDVLGIITKPFSDAATAISKAWTTSATFIKGIPADIKGYFSDAIHWLEDAGKDIVQGLINGIGSLASKVTDKVKSLANDVKNIPKKILSIFSPSKVFEEYGKNIMQGFANGIGNNAGLATDAVGDVANNVSAFGAQAGSTSSNSSSGPLVHMENVNISSSVDLDLVTQQVTAAIYQGRV